jgi:hypothetical protein
MPSTSRMSAPAAPRLDQALIFAVETQKVEGHQRGLRSAIRALLTTGNRYGPLVA